MPVNACIGPVVMCFYFLFTVSCSLIILCFYKINSQDQNSALLTKYAEVKTLSCWKCSFSNIDMIEK